MLPRERTRLRRSRVDHCFPLKTAFCLLVVFGLAGVPAVAQQRIAGVVRRNGTRERLRDVEVSLTGEVLGEPETTQTDAEGRYSFPHLSPGDYTVATQTERFYPEKVQVSLGPRATRHVDFDLTPISSLHEQVTVRAEKGLLDQSRSSTVISLDRKRISELPEAQRMQLTDIVKPFVASAVASHDNFVHLRGNELSLNTFINGVSFFDNPHQLFTPGISADIIQSVNVITGGFPAEFGNRFGGILDIVTRSGFDMENQGHVTLGGSTSQDRFPTRREGLFQAASDGRRDQLRVAQYPGRRLPGQGFLSAQSGTDGHPVLGPRLFRPLDPVDLPV
ncbi:MAG: carboxypeptidase regulatory-like domain-containing protein [Acidobacteriota bacterium]